MYYKAPDNSLHFLDFQEFENLLPAGSVRITDSEAAAIRAAQNVLTPAQIEASFTASIQQRLDDFARTRNYDSILSACTYATSKVAKFAAEGQRCVDLRDNTWAAAYSILDEVLAGTRTAPTSITDIEADLPALNW